MNWRNYETKWEDDFLVKVDYLDFNFNNHVRSSIGHSWISAPS